MATFEALRGMAALAAIGLGPSARGRALVTGATGFVGRHVAPTLEAAGWEVRRGSRDPGRAAAVAADREWVACDVDDPATLPGALDGCDVAVYLVHGIGQGPGWDEREQAGALAFRRAAERAGVRRVVYLGGAVPAGPPSRHLASRLETGRLLRAGALDVVELRAAMVIGAGSASWLIVRDLAARLPAMILPRWLENRSWPVAIDDVAAAVLRALDREAVPAGAWDLPGAERLSHRALLARVAARLGRRPPMVGVPVVTPALSAWWIRLVTRAGGALVHELVDGLTSDLDPVGPVFWEAAPDLAPTPLDLAFDRALADEGLNEPPGPETLARLRALAPAAAAR